MMSTLTTTEIQKYVFLVTIIGCPAAAITISASRMILSGLLVREWKMVTVASAFRSSNEIGNPTILFLFPLYLYYFVIKVQDMPTYN